MHVYNQGVSPTSGTFNYDDILSNFHPLFLDDLADRIEKTGSDALARMLGLPEEHAVAASAALIHGMRRLADAKRWMTQFTKP